MKSWSPKKVREVIGMLLASRSGYGELPISNRRAKFQRKRMPFAL